MNSFSLNEIIEFAIQIEQRGYSFYDNSLKRKDISKEAREILTFLKFEEMNHEKTFINLRNEEDIASIIEAGDWQTVGSYLKTITESHIFNKPDAPIAMASQAKNDKEIIEFAIAFEKDTLLFFHSLENSVSDEKTKAILKKIIAEEIGHIMKLKNFCKTE
ncbi:MAG: ferritin family protein [Candidatus Cloacimonetes bacterium]|nr:ferritin family protein [Candidatus Cloacimonadota bacterium]